MKAILFVDIPDDYQEYGSGKWYIKGDLLRIGYEEKNGSFIGKKRIENEMVQLKPMPQKNKYDVEKYATVDYENDVTIGHFLNAGYNQCIDDILGE